MRHIKHKNIKGTTIKPIFSLAVKTAITHAFSDNSDRFIKLIQLLDISKHNQFTVAIRVNTKQFVNLQSNYSLLSR